MTTYVFSASNCAFFPVIKRDVYLAAGWDLSDAVEVSDDVYREFNAGKEGKVLGVIDGLPLPAWVDKPAPTHEQLVAQAEQQKSQLRKVADSEIEWRKYAVDKGIATAEESAAFDEWNLYRVLLMRIDTSKAPDIEWPPMPSA
ncbi:tail fiber assembly protein [Hafnia paralvei]|uniref:tail fiber assembly protein n=1 Tax=Hafnia paralvei TaxID=546367 RepID=UPI0039FCECF5